MKFTWKKALLALAIFNLFLASWHVLRSDLRFQTDIARDFLLLTQIEEKKLMLIGPRAGAGGFFHGPLWSYLNFPAYFVGNGDPVVVGWFWVLLTLGFYISSFKVAKKLFGDKSAYVYLVLISFYMIPEIREFTHTQAAMLVMPLFFYSFWKYIKTFKSRYLIVHILSAGVLIQFEIAAGAPFLLLSFLYILYIQIKKKKLRQIRIFLLLLIPLSTYIVFDLRHDFFMTKNLILYIKEGSQNSPFGFKDILLNRLNFVTVAGVPLLYKSFLLNRILASGFLIALISGLRKEKRYRQLYTVFLYFIIGYFVLSFSSRHFLLRHHFMAFIPIVLMIFASLVTSGRLKKIFLPIFVFIIILNSQTHWQLVKEINNNFIGRDEDSWRFLAQLSEGIFSSGDKEFGYFVYSPDKFAYEPKYAMWYGKKQYPEIEAKYFQKKSITYIVSAPPPPNDPYMLSRWWIENSIKIKKEPVEIINYSNGYKVRRYELTPEEIAIPFDQHEDCGIHFR